MMTAKNLLKTTLWLMVFSPFLFLIYVLNDLKNREPQHSDQLPNSGWVELKIQTVSGEIISLSCPQREGAPMGAHSVDCYIKLEQK